MIRASALGRYLACPVSRHFDRLADEGHIKDNREFENSPYAALGTVIHYAIQKGIGCEFPASETPPTHEDRLLALELVADIDEAGANALRLAAPILADLAGGTWKAECENADESIGLSGHADLISADGKILVDIKTTARKPTKLRPKSSNIAQMVAYHRLFPGVERAYLLYIHSLKQQWAVLSQPIVFGDENVQPYVMLVDQAIKRLQSPRLDNCWPNLSACDEYFCPWRDICRDSVVPGPGTEVKAPKEPEVVMKKAW